MGYGSMMAWGGGWGGGHMFGFVLIGSVLVAVVVLVLLAARSRSGKADTAGPRADDRARVILKERYARGEVDKTEFDARMRDLS
jgi:putative membrane protein